VSSALHLDSLDLFVVYLTMPSAPKTIQCQMTRILMNNEMERKWKEAVAAQFRVLF
jgi:hypothetical protein